MRINIFLLALACLSHHAYCRRFTTDVDDQDPSRATVAFLLAHNPLPVSSVPRTTRDSQTTHPTMLLSNLNLANTNAGSIAEFVKDASRLAFLPRPDKGVVVPRYNERRGNLEPKRYDGSNSVPLQGESLKTWTYQSVDVERVQVVLTTEGRPLNADVELWNGPDNTPVKMRVFSEDGNQRPFSVVVETPRSPNTIAIRNIGPMETPLAAHLLANQVDEPLSDFFATARSVQGGALRTYPFASDVQSVEIMLKTDGRPLNARIELLQGPSNNKQIIELYTEDGINYPFFAIMETPGSGNVVRVVNTAPIEFPMIASVQPYWIDESVASFQPIIGER